MHQEFQPWTGQLGIRLARAHTQLQLAAVASAIPYLLLEYPLRRGEAYGKQ